MGHIGLGTADDLAIFHRARRDLYTIVSLDGDFADILAALGPPPKVVWLRCGNRTSSFLLTLLLDRVAAIEAFGEDPEASCLQIRL